MKVFSICFIFFSLFFIIEAKAISFDEDIKVDITANTVTEAKAQAMTKATREALSSIVGYLSTEKSVEEINKLNDNQLLHFISGVMVLMEKSSEVRYIAELRVSVDEQILKDYMRENDMPFIVTETQEILIIPMFENEDGTLNVWGDENIWRQAFLERGKMEYGALIAKVIDKNLGNISAVQTNRFYDMTEGEYGELANFNRINNVAVLKYSLKDKKIYIKSFPELTIAELAFDKETIDELIDKVLLLLKGKLKQEEVFDNNEIISATYDVVYEYPMLSKWTGLKNILTENPQVSEFMIVSMGNGKVRFKFDYNGKIEKLQKYLGEYQYQMRNERGYYVIY